MSATTDPVAEIHAEHARQVDAIHGDGTLSPDGRREQLAALSDATASRLGAVRAGEDAASASDLAAAERVLFGSADNSPTGLISRRDAMDRAERCTSSADAQRLLERAGMTGDEDLAQAVLAVAIARQWTGVVDSWAAEHPEAHGALDRVLSARWRPGSDVKARVVRSIRFSPPSTKGSVR